MGLTAIQHNGNLVLKIHEMQDALTCGLVFMLYTLFQRVSVIKPYTVDFSSNRQYLVCIGLKQRRPIEVIR